MKYISFNAGILTARYDSDIHGAKIPSDAIEVSDELFHETIQDTDGVWALVDGHVIKLPPLPPTAEQLQAKTNAEARAYLSNTDWYVTRLAETGVSIPSDILAARQEARASIVEAAS